MHAKLLKPSKIVVRVFRGVSHEEMKRLLRTRTQKKFGFKEVAYEVEDLGKVGKKDQYDVRLEYIA